MIVSSTLTGEFTIEETITTGLIDASEIHDTEVRKIPLKANFSRDTNVKSDSISVSRGTGITNPEIISSAIGQDNITIDSILQVNGTVLNENGDTLPFANIVIKGTDIGVITDLNGAFKLEIPKNLQDSLVLVISYLGYDSKEINLNGLARNYEISPVYLTSNMTLHVAGGVMYQTPRQRFLGRIRGFFWRLFH